LRGTQVAQEAPRRPPETGARISPSACRRPGPPAGAAWGSTPGWFGRCRTQQRHAGRFSRRSTTRWMVYPR